MSRFYSILIVLCIASLANAQGFHWEPTPGPIADAPTVIVVNSNKDIVAGKGREFFRSRDGGNS